MGDPSPSGRIHGQGLLRVVRRTYRVRQVQGVIHGMRFTNERVALSRVLTVSILRALGSGRLLYRYLICLGVVGVSGIFLSQLTTPKNGRNGGKTLNK